jgi:hypothetical protein
MVVTNRSYDYEPFYQGQFISSVADPNNLRSGLTKKLLDSFSLIFKLNRHLKIDPLKIKFDRNTSISF